MGVSAGGLFAGMDAFFGGGAAAGGGILDSLGLGGVTSGLGAGVNALTGGLSAGMAGLESLFGGGAQAAGALGADASGALGAGVPALTDATATAAPGVSPTLSGLTQGSGIAGGVAAGGPLAPATGSSLGFSGGSMPMGGVLGGGGSAAGGAGAAATPISLSSSAVGSGVSGGVPTAPGSSGFSLGGLGSTALKYGPLALTGGLLAKTALGGSTNGLPAASSLSPEMLASATQNLQQGQALEGYLSSGTLPPGMQSGIDAAREAEASSIRSQYASRGMSGSSAEAQDIQNLHDKYQSQVAQIGQQLYATGLQETNLGNGVYEQLLQQSLSNNKDYNNSIAAFAAALAKMGGGTSATA